MNTDMIIGKRLREIREARKLSQGDIERRTGLIRCYVSRVENGHTVPAVETLEKFARALEVPMCALFYDEEPSKPRGRRFSKFDKDTRELDQLQQALAKMPKNRRELLSRSANPMRSQAKFLKPAEDCKEFLPQRLSSNPALFRPALTCL